MVDKNHSVARRSAALLATVCTLGSLAVTPIANAAPEQEPATTQQTTNQPQADNVDKSGNTADNANKGDANVNDTNKDDAANGVATVTSADGKTVTPYSSFSEAVSKANVKTGETVTLIKSTSENVDVADGVENYTVTAAPGAVYSGTMKVHGAVTITGMTFSLDGTNGTTTSVAVPGAGKVKIENNTFSVAEGADTSQSYNGIQLDQGAGDITISGNTFNFSVPQNNKDRRAVNIQGNSPIKTVAITSNRLNVTGEAGKGTVMLLSAFGNTANGYGVTNLTVTGNAVTATAEAKKSAYGAYVQGVQGLTFTGNAFTNVSQALQSTKNNPVTVGGNTFKGTTTSYRLDTLNGLTFSKPDTGNISTRGIAAGVPGENGTITPYATLAEAIEAAQNGDTVTLLSDVTLSKTLTIDRTITLDGHGHSLNGQLVLGSQATGTQITNVHFILNSTTKVTSFSSNVTISAADRVQVTGNTFTITADAKITSTSGRAVGVNVQVNPGEKVEDTVISGNTFNMADGVGDYDYHYGVLLTNEVNSGTEAGVINTVISNNTMLGATKLYKTRFLSTYDTAKEPRLGVSGVTVTGNKLAVGEGDYTDLLIDFWGGTTGITLSGNEFGAGRMGVLFRAQTFQQGKKTALQENITITGNTFNSNTAVVDAGGIKVSEKSPFIFGGEHADENKFGKNTVPFAGATGDATLFYGVTYRIVGTDELESFEAVAENGTVANIPSKDGYTTRVYVKDGDTVKLFDPSTKVTKNLTLYVTFTSNGGNGGGTVTPTPKPDPEPTPSKSPFIDVIKDKTPHYEDILWLADQGISTGWKETDGTVTFRPAADVNRQDMAAFLYRLAGSPEFDVAKADNPFTDVTAETPHYKEILWLYSTGITTGYRNADGTLSFQGLVPVFRQDMAAFLHRFAEYEKAKDPSGESQDFTDVDETTPHYEDIQWLSKTGVTEGYANGTFGGMTPVYRQDMAAFLHRMHDNVLNK